MKISKNAFFPFLCDRYLIHYGWCFFMMTQNPETTPSSVSCHTIIATSAQENNKDTFFLHTKCEVCAMPEHQSTYLSTVVSMMVARSEEPRLTWLFWWYLSCWLPLVGNNLRPRKTQPNRKTSIIHLSARLVSKCATDWQVSKYHE